MRLCLQSMENSRHSVEVTSLLSSPIIWHFIISRLFFLIYIISFESYYSSVGWAEEIPPSNYRQRKWHFRCVSEKIKSGIFCIYQHRIYPVSQINAKCFHMLKYKINTNSLFHSYPHFPSKVQGSPRWIMMESQK